MRYALLAFVALIAGCVPVTEPLGDVEKAEPDKAVVGAWSDPNSTDTVALVIDVPEVKGNPKGLMRVAFEGKTDGNNALWFTASAVGKARYANILLTAAGEPVSPAFATEGEFAKWQKEPAKRYFVFRYTLDGEKLAIDGGSEKRVKAVLEGAKVAKNDKNYYQTPAGWLAAYLDKNDPATIFDGSNVQKYSRLKKK